MAGFEWDEEKRRRNFEDHGVDFRLAARIFANPVLESEDRRGDYGETRFRALGYVGEDFYSSSIRGAETTAGSSALGRSVRMAGRDTRHYSLEDLERMAAKGEYEPTRPDAPKVDLDEDFWRTARLIMPGETGKTSLHLRVDTDVVEWFKRQGKGHLTRMNAVLRAYMEAHRQHKR